jgi:transcriptional regulator GlxA family with amidase domain
VNYGMLLFPTFQALDVFGPLDIIQSITLNGIGKINLSFISNTLSPVSTKPRSPTMNTTGSDYGYSILPTHTFDNAPPLDVLIVPGGMGTRAPDLDAHRAFIKRTYPTLKYLITVCTGSALVASTGILDGKNATSNKASWKWVVSQGPNVNWVPRARWTVDGNIWTSSGVAAGIDVTFAYVEELYGKDVADTIMWGMEYERHLDAHRDPFGDYWNTTYPIV